MSGEHLVHDVLNLGRKDVFSCDSVSLRLAESAAVLREALSRKSGSFPLFAHGRQMQRTKSLGFPRTGTETKVQVHVYLGGSSRKLPIGGIGGSEKTKGRKPIKGAVLSPMGSWSWVLWESVWNTHFRGEGVGVFIYRFLSVIR